MPLACMYTLLYLTYLAWWCMFSLKKCHFHMICNCNKRIELLFTTIQTLQFLKWAIHFKRRLFFLLNTSSFHWYLFIDVFLNRCMSRSSSFTHESFKNVNIYLYFNFIEQFHSTMTRSKGIGWYQSLTYVSTYVLISVAMLTSY